MQTGLYTVIAGDSNNCVNSANKYVLIEGVDDLSDNENIFVFPNPSNGHFMVEWLNASLAASGSSAGDEISISIFNALGQEMFSSEASGSIGTTSSYKKEIDISGVAPGVYFLEINSNHFSVKRKIVIER
jgi:hypothetical protein